MGHHGTIRREVAGETCPTINRVQKGISDAMIELNRAGENLADLDALLEEIRDANSSLRDALAEKMGECAALEEEKSSLETERDGLQEENDELKETVQKLEEQIRELEAAQKGAVLATST